MVFRPVEKDFLTLTAKHRVKVTPLHTCPHHTSLSLIRFFKNRAPCCFFFTFLLICKPFCFIPIQDIFFYQIQNVHKKHLV